ncbi:PIN domain-containing protein [Thioflexithrix psekupsensis]|uniref:PIN domain-containing protein n=1 Tax=Thioflexithrix psekupsensis TaxID=1570016 RepID=UPI00111CC81E|nr:PIN domain-containing protein [Thioflexithrix psekupsensis]
MIDYENVQPKSLSLLNAHVFKLLVFVGANQTKIPFEMAVEIQQLGNKAEYVKIGGSGPNALDFHIAFYLGELVQKDPSGYFHIVSKDTGFDPLIKHLKEKKIFAQRKEELNDIQILNVSSSTTMDEKISAVVQRLASCANKTTQNACINKYN